MTYTVTMNEVEFNQFKRFQELIKIDSNYTSTIDADFKNNTLTAYTLFGGVQKYDIEKITHENMYQTTMQITPISCKE